MPGNSPSVFAMACAAIAVIGCTEPTFDSLAPTEQLPGNVAKPGAPGAARDRLLYQVRLGPLGENRSHGIVLIEVVGGHLAVSVHAAGLVPDEIIPQHIHVNPTCDPGGGVLINLDANLTVGSAPPLPPEGPGVGLAYPRANDGGVVKYYASRPLSELLPAINTHFGLTLGSIEELLTWLDLENRNAHMHVPFGPPFPAVNCGEVLRLN
jgi:hypothetical protein